MTTTTLERPTATPCAPPPPPTRVLLEPSHWTKKRQFYRVLREDGSVLIAATTDPEHDACRALQAEGLNGKLVTRWAGAAHDSLTMGIEWGAKRVAVESATRTLRTALREPFDPSRRPTASMSPPNAVSRVRHSPPAARERSPGVSGLKTRSAAGEKPGADKPETVNR